jgi:hypothetical protein
MAFEYQRPHHFSVDYVKVHDAIKRQSCAENGVRLIEVPFPPENVLAEVAQAFRTHGIDERPVMPSELFHDELRQLQEIARKRGGTLVSSRYLGSDAAQWHCGNPGHPSWHADAWRVVKRGAWCPSCAGNRRFSLEDFRKWGAVNRSRAARHRASRWRASAVSMAVR